MPNYDAGPSKRTAKRAANLWRRLLSDPKYDNGDDSLVGLVTVALARRIPSNATELLLNQFAEQLERYLLDESQPLHMRNTMGTDYGPDQILSMIADEVGLKLEWPWKTVMHVYDDHVNLKSGYRADFYFHYPLPGNKWLVTTLQGSDMSLILDAVDRGIDLGLTIEGDE